MNITLCALLAKVLTLWICRYVLVIELIKLKLSLFSIFLGRPPDLIYSSNLPHTPHNHQKYSWIRLCFKGVSIQIKLHHTVRFTLLMSNETYPNEPLSFHLWHANNRSGRWLKSANKFSKTQGRAWWAVFIWL